MERGVSISGHIIAIAERVSRDGTSASQAQAVDGAAAPDPAAYALMTMEDQRDASNSLPALPPPKLKKQSWGMSTFARRTSINAMAKVCVGINGECVYRDQW